MFSSRISSEWMTVMVLLVLVSDRIQMQASLVNGHLPHLALDKANALKETALDAGESDLVRTARVVVRPVDKVVPDLPITIESPVAVSAPLDVVTAKEPNTSLVLISDRERVLEPVLDVGVPQESALEVDVHIAEPSGVHDRLHIVGLVGEDHRAPAVRRIVTALLESLNNRRRRVSAVETRLHDADRTARNTG